MEVGMISVGEVETDVAETGRIAAVSSDGAQAAISTATKRRTDAVTNSFGFPLGLDCMPLLTFLASQAAAKVEF